MAGKQLKRPLSKQHCSPGLNNDLAKKLRLKLKWGARSKAS
jgi:hypothetical protein